MNDRNGVRSIDAGAPPSRFARGWHCLGLAAPFRDGNPHAVEAFGTKLVVFAGESGELNVLDGYCRHMGGDLSRGTIKGDAIACPFHDWRWGGDGKCVKIPYSRRVPPTARTRSWLTLVQNQQLFVWNDPEGNPPPAEVTIPRIDGAYSSDWSNWTWDSLTVDANCREVVDNVVDMAHFFYIHFAFPTYFRNVFEGHIATQYLKTRSRPDYEPDPRQASGPATEIGLVSEAAYYGPSYMIDYLNYDYHGVPMDAVLINCHYPVTPERFVLQWGVIVKKLPGLSPEQADKVAAKFARFVGLGFQQDVDIWTHKSRIDNPLLCADDGPVYQLRRWYEQFYLDLAAIPADMVARHEFEVDTSRAVQAWEAEVAANLAARQPVASGVETGVAGAAGMAAAPAAAGTPGVPGAGSA
ncbi:MAG TPA: Rieske 2Fe-2S domain-containing protein [Streptosporangiaceae bacterium]|nr:Rieske 2Fe-2S domain-containing protein [Streptosporangiaceae bacterium]